MRASTFQRIDIPLSRDLQTDYDKIIQLTEHLDAITAVGDMVENGVDFNELLTLTSTVEDHTTALDGKVDKVAGSSLMTDAERAKLQFIAQQATKNQADAYLVDRANHTGTQSADTVVDGVVNVAMTAAERTRLAAMDDEANNYVHPSTHPVSILDGGVNYNKVVKTDALGNVGFGDTSWADVVGKPSTYTPTAHEHSMDEVTSGTISATRVVPTETRQFVNASQLASIADMELQTNKGIPNGYAPLNANGKINASYLGDLNLMEVFTPNDLNSMLNLTSAQPGDIAYRLDTGNSYMLIALPSSLEANWKQLNSGAGVVSVNGLDGIVTLGSANVPESGTNYYFTNERVDDRVTGLLQAGTNISLVYDDAANTLTVNANDVSVDWSEIQNKPDPVVTVKLQGDVTGTANATMTDMGNATVTVTTTVAANSVALGTDTTGNYVADVTAGTYVTKSGTAGEGWSPTINVDATSTNTASKVVARDASGNFAAGTITAALTGNASTATKLATARNISLSGDVSGTVSFDGSAEVNIATTVADDSHLHAFTNLTSKPTTVSGYGITDVYTKTESNAASSLKANLASPALTGTPTAPTAAVGTNTTQLATTAFVKAEIANDSTVVHKTGNETVAGIKTFSSSPIVPTPTTNMQAANKAYVDDKILQATSTEVYAGPYGLNWDETNDVYLRTGSTNYKAIQSLMRRCVMNDDGTVNYYLHPHNSNYKADGTAADLTGASGNVMVEVPKFYYKYNYNTTVGVVHEHSISLIPLDGYIVHDAFVRGGVEMANRYYPAYLGYSTGSKLLSRSGVYPTVGQTRAQFRTLARANGTGWEQIDFLLYEAITLLMVIEYGTMNIQSALGQGRTALTGGTWAGSSLIGINGLSNGVGNGTANVSYAGSADDAAADGSFMTYRGCENFFGNIWRFVDGINCNGSNSKLVYLNMNPATYADSVITGDYVSIGVTSAAASGYVRKLGNTRKGFIPTDITGGTSANGTTDYYYTSTTVDTLALVGGYAAAGLSAGPLYLNVYHSAASFSDAIVGCGVSF